MYRHLGRTTLTTGEEMDLGVVEAPDPAWAAQLDPFLGHKPNEYRFHVQESLQKPLDALQTLFYIGTLGGRVITHVMIVGSGGVGILGHVYTLPEHRRKKAFHALMRAQMDDCIGRNYMIITLGTGYDSPPYWIYHGFGFRSITPGSGSMMWSVGPDAVSTYWREGAATARPVLWADWPHLDLLVGRPAEAMEEQPRSFYFGISDRGSMEGPFLALAVAQRRDASIQAAVLHVPRDMDERGSIVGLAVLAPEARSFGARRVLDVYVHPRWFDQAAELARSVLAPGTPVVSYTTATDGVRSHMLTGLGFKHEASLRRAVRTSAGLRDLTMYVHEDV